MAAVKVDLNTPGMPGLLAWMKTYRPDWLRVVQKKLPSAPLAGLGDVLAPVSFDTSLVSTPAVSSSSSWGDTIKDAITAASSAYLTKSQIDAQKQILDLQIERARAGLPPANIDPSQYGVPNVNIGVSADTKQMLLIGGGVLALLVVGSMLTGRRRGR